MLVRLYCWLFPCLGSCCNPEGGWASGPLLSSGQAVFPEAECATDEWLSLLAELGMKTDVDRDAFLECARKVQQLGGAQPFGAPRAVPKAAFIWIYSRTAITWSAITDLGSEKAGSSRLDPA